MFQTFPSAEAYAQYLKDARGEEEARRIREAGQWNRSEFLAFLEGYTVCAFWSSQEDDSPELDRDKRTIDAMRAMDAACLAFVTANMSDLFNLNPAQCGHDFWLSRNRHGTGFWDRDLGAVGDRLHEAAKACGEAHLYLGDDGNVHYA